MDKCSKALNYQVQEPEWFELSSDKDTHGFKEMLIDYIQNYGEP